ncbi:hypothetical protein ACG3SL_11515 [Sphingomonas sp. CJ20]
MSILSLAPLLVPAALRPKAPARPATSTPTPATTPREQAAERKLAQAQSAVATLEASKTDQAESAKATAREKVRQLKERLKALQMLAAFDPKAAARAAAAIARELGAAVKQYQDAGGSAGDLGATTDAAAPEAAADAGTEAQASDTTDAATPDPADAAKEPADPADAKDSDLERYRERVAVAQSSARQADGKADAEFARDARDAAAQIKALIRRAKDDRDPDDKDVRDAEHALAKVEDQLNAPPDATLAGAAPGILASISA